MNENIFSDNHSKAKSQKVIISLIVFCALPVVLLIFGIFYGIIGSNFITPKVVKDTVFDCFNVGQPYHPINGMNDAGNGYIMISANADDAEQAMIQLRKVYSKLSKKISTKKVDKITIGVYGPDKQTLLLSSDIWIKDLKNIEWLAIERYDDFAVKANVTLAKEESTLKQVKRDKQIARFTGSENKQTKKFTIESDEFDIKWKNSPDDENIGGNLGIVLYDTDGNYIDLVANSIAKASEESTFYNGGEYYLDITCSNSEYDIRIIEVNDK